MRENSQILNCNHGCCKLFVEPYRYTNNNIYTKKYKSKAGALIYDEKNDCILLVQSRGNFWGLPKGTFENLETSSSCAIREVKEETGLELNEYDLTKPYYIDRACYFYVSHQCVDCKIQKNKFHECNDANGIGWIKLDCLKDLVNNNIIRLNYHTKLCLRRYLKLNLII